MAKLTNKILYFSFKAINTQIIFLLSKLKTSSNGLKAGSVETIHTVFSALFGQAFKTLNIDQDFFMFGKQNGELCTWFHKLEFCFVFSFNENLNPPVCSTVPASLRA